MVDLSELQPPVGELLAELNRATGGRREAQASMYDLGAALGLDRDASGQAAEELIALGLVEIRTLSGGIGLSEAGAAAVASPPERRDRSPRLGTESPLDASRRDLVEGVLTGLKSELGSSGMAFEPLAEMMADIRTIEAQMASPHPKTAIVRLCFESLMKTAGAQRKTEWQRRLEAFLA